MLPTILASDWLERFGAQALLLVLGVAMALAVLAFLRSHRRRRAEAQAFGAARGWRLVRLHGSGAGDFEGAVDGEPLRLTHVGTRHVRSFHAVLGAGEPEWHVTLGAGVAGAIDRWADALLTGAVHVEAPQLPAQVTATSDRPQAARRLLADPAVRGWIAEAFAERSQRGGQEPPSWIRVRLGGSVTLIEIPYGVLRFEEADRLVGALRALRQAARHPLTSGSSRRR